ncbi:MAG: amidase [Acidimicrobiales bacterium]|nr:amidase [Acidimicrobiales bacterium]
MGDATWITVLDPDSDPRALPDGPTVAVKDCIDLEGVVTTAGSEVVAAQSDPAPADAECLAGFRSIGARFVGKANLHELCFGATGVNVHYGTPTNPIDEGRIPGGSSSGCAVAVATGEARFAIGTDTTGSVRTPSACCGVVGLKPTFGVVPVAGTRPLAPSLDTIGVFARTVADVAVAATLLDDRLSQGEVDPYGSAARIRLPDTDPTIDAAVDSALLEAGIDIVDVDLPGWGEAQEAAVMILYAEALMVNQDLWDNHQESLGPDLVERFLLAQAISPDELSAARAVREKWRAELAAVLDDHGVLALPTMTAYPARLGEQRTPPNPTCPAISLAGNPAIALPVPSGGLFPASVQLVAHDRRESRLLATAALVEAAN